MNHGIRFDIFFKKKKNIEGCYLYENDNRGLYAIFQALVTKIPTQECIINTSTETLKAILFATLLIGRLQSAETR